MESCSHKKVPHEGPSAHVGLGGKRTFAVQKGMAALPPIADMGGAKRNVRFVPIADISAYSIISSARESKLGGTVRPMALADFKLITSSYLFGSCTGNSAGFSPLRIRST
jgi:hypothetical protein